MAQPLAAPYCYFADSSGNPLAGGKIFTYAAGTLTPQASYTDSTGVTPLANPVILDSAGRSQIWLQGYYKIIVKDSLDNVISTADNITAISSTGDMNTSLYDPAGIHEQLVGLNAVQTLTNKTLTAGTLAGITNLSGGQILFPATQSASSNVNTLDDYEEGTWTPVLTFNTPGNLTVVYSTQVGTYTKIGREVTLRCVLILSTFTHTTASGNLQITGLPFAHATVTGLASSGVVDAWSGITKASYTQISASIASAASLITLTASGSGQSATNIAPADMPTGGTPQMRITITYQTAT